MKTHLIDTHLLVPTKVKVICKGQISGSCFSKDWCFGGISVSQTHLVYLCQNYVTGKGCLMSFTLSFGFIFTLNVNHFLISLRQFKTYVADRKPQTISFFPIYTKLYYRKRGLNDKLIHKLYKC